MGLSDLFAQAEQLGKQQGLKLAVFYNYEEGMYSVDFINREDEEVVKTQEVDLETALAKALSVCKA